MNIEDRSPDTSAASIVGEGFRNHQQRNAKTRKKLVLFVLPVVAVELAARVSSFTVDVGVSNALLFGADIDAAPDPPARVDR